jgi:hypothetical protein
MVVIKVYKIKKSFSRELEHKRNFKKSFAEFLTRINHPYQSQESRNNLMTVTASAFIFDRF